MDRELSFLNDEISQLFDQTDVILSLNRDNINQLKSLNRQISFKLQTMDTTLNELLQLTHNLNKQNFETVTYKPERSEDLIRQMKGYLKSIDIDSERRQEFENILNATEDLEGLVGLNEFISSLESCIGSFYVH